MQYRWLRIPTVCIVLFLAVATCGVMPQAIFYAVTGHGPMTRPQYEAWLSIKGRTREEVVELLGKPHEIGDQSPDREVWYYYADLFGVAIYCLEFGPNGRVTKIWS